MCERMSACVVACVRSSVRACVRVCVCELEGQRERERDKIDGLNKRTAIISIRFVAGTTLTNSVQARCVNHGTCAVDTTRTTQRQGNN